MRHIITLTECVLFLSTAACEGCFDVGPPDAGPSEGEGEGEPVGIALNEIMASNGRTLADASGAYPDWVELKNLDSEAKDLTGYTLSDDPDDPARMVFGAGTTLPANGYLIVFCDGDIDEDTPSEPHAPFRLSAAGEELHLGAPDGARLDGVTYPALGRDESYGRLPDGTGELVKLPAPTPRLPNDTEMPDAGDPVDAGCTPPFASAPALVVNEALANNVDGLVDPADGQTDSWVELYNAGASTLALDGVVLSDDASLSATWALPADASLAPGEHLVVFMDASPAQGALHASLLLTPFDEAVSVGDRCGTIFHTLALAGGAADVSVGLLPDGETANAPVPLDPTPGAANQAP